MSAQTPASDLSAILAGERVEVVFLDDSRRVVFVRALPARTLLTDYLSVLDAESVMLEKVCVAIPGETLPAGWIDALSDASHAALVEKAEQLNFARASAQAERQARRMAGLKAVETHIASLLVTSQSPR